MGFLWESASGSIDKKNKVSNKDILKKRLAKGELSIEEFRTLIDEL
jgi:uncharacterized membrane protein